MIKAFSITDIGKIRQVNQDYVFVTENAVGCLDNLLIVADGMGGHKAGEHASKCTVETMVSEIEAYSGDDPGEILKYAIFAANNKVFNEARGDVNLHGMGTTVVAATYKDKKLYTANVGDSRLYLVNDALRQITKDHSLVAEMVEKGGLDAKSARVHPRRNVITRAVGAEAYIKVDLFVIPLKDGDMVLMCSDGLTVMLSDEEIFSILSENSGEGSLEKKALRLVDAANIKGGRDNIAVVLMSP